MAISTGLKNEATPVSHRFISFVIVAVLILQHLLILSPSNASAAGSTSIVISQAYGGGGATTGSPAYINDYVELFNTSNSTVNISGWSLQYGSSKIGRAH